MSAGSTDPGARGHRIRLSQAPIIDPPLYGPSLSIHRQIWRPRGPLPLSGSSLIDLLIGADSQGWRRGGGRKGDGEGWGGEERPLGKFLIATMAEKERSGCG
ncbi:hypothetical protein E2562_031312 [Oryza meyeriana var. granulata]|uniref:Uncharacterized protein n=1 Tax=Oryza meyeriana var. granulata TaxID=110450 RepID=A0A6G1C9Z1_9ORYZ|nr:hypothetical protein E2562_031312 [Oryza meyeriana var. granulata]